MRERIKRHTDENLYQPRIHSRRIRELYTLKEVTGIPMTVLVDLAIQEFIEKRGADHETFISNMQEREPQEEPIQPKCNYCGPGWPAVWELVTDLGEETVCDNHHFILREIHSVKRERKIGEKGWIEVDEFKKLDFADEHFEDLGDWKDLIDHSDL